MIPTRPCRWCGLPIGLVATTKGRMMPIDPTPNDDGNVLVERLDGGVLRAHVIGKSTEQQLPVGTRFMTHFATCDRYPKGRR